MQNQRHSTDLWHCYTHTVSWCHLTFCYPGIDLDFSNSLFSLKLDKQSQTLIQHISLVLERRGGGTTFFLCFSELFVIVSGERAALKALYFKQLFVHSSFLLINTHCFDICRFATMKGQ